MARSRKSAKAAGTKFERDQADHWKKKLDNKHIDRQIKTGGKDKGDIRGVEHLGQDIAIECKDYGGQIKAGPWIKEAHAAMKNKQAGASLVLAKRRGTTNPNDQWVITTVGDMLAIMTGKPREEP